MSSSVIHHSLINHHSTINTHLITIYSTLPHSLALDGDFSEVVYKDCLSTSTPSLKIIHQSTYFIFTKLSISNTHKKHHIEMVQVFPSPSLPTIKATLKYLKPNQPGQSLSLFLIQPIHSKLEKTPFNLFSISLSMSLIQMKCFITMSIKVIDLKIN